VAVKKYPKKAKVKISDNFNSSEFDCPCSHCDSTLIDDRLIERLQRTRGILGVPLQINSAYRCKDYQEDLRRRGYETASGISQHELGGAADVMRAGDSHLSGEALEKAARKAGFKAVGVSTVWIHADVRDDKERRWEYVKR
jgi:uncharacterized protein YcbK (DUF882 family)